MASSGSTYIDVLPNMSRYFREARSEIAANRITGRVDVEVERSSLRRAERQLERLADRNVSARNRSIAAAERQATAERDLREIQARSNVTTEQYAQAVERVGRAQRAAAEAATARVRAQRDLNEGRDTLNTIRTRLDTAEAEAQHRGFIERISRTVATITARIDLATAPYRAALRAATRPITQTVRLTINNGVTRTAATLLTTFGKYAGLLGAATIAAGGLVAPIGAAAVVAADLAGLVALLPAAALAAGAAFAAIKIGISGIGESLKGIGSAAASGGSGGSQAASQAKAVARAEKQLTQAQKGAQRAQADLNRERGLAVRRLRDMAAAVGQGARDERGAAIELQRAKDALASAGADGETVSFLDRDQMQLDVENAEANLERIKTAQTDLVADNEKAQKAGIEGDAGVVAARQAVEDSTDSVTDAVNALAEANAAMGSGAAASLSPAEEAYAKLSTNAKAFVDTIKSLMPQFDSLKNSVQDALFDGLNYSLAELVRVQLPGVKAGLTAIATEVNGGVRAAIAGLSVEIAKARLDTVLGNTAIATGNLADSFAPFVRGFLAVAAVGSEFLPGFTSGIGGVAESFATWANDTDRVRAFIQKALDTASQLGDVLGNLGGIIGDVFSAANSAGGGLLGNLVSITGQIREFTSSAEGAQILGTFFESVGAVLSTIMPIVLEIAKIVGGTVVPAIASFVTAAGPGVVELVKALGAGLAALAPAFGPLGEAVSAIATALAPALVPLGEAIGAIITALAPVLPFLAELVSLLVQELAPVFTELASAMAPVISALLDQLAPYLPKIAELFGQVAGAIGTALVDAITAIAPHIPKIVDAFIQILDALIPVLPIILDLAATLIESLAPVLPDIADLIANILVPAIQVLAPVLQFVAWVVGLVAGMFADQLKSAVENMNDRFEKFGDMVERVKEWFNGLLVNIGEFVAGAAVKFEDFKRFVADIPNKVREFFSDAGEWLKDAGKKIIDGFIDGIKGKFNDVKDTLGNLTDKLTEWKGPPQRDATLLHDAGATIIGGFIKGLESQYDAVKASLGGLTADIAATAVEAPAAPTMSGIDTSAVKAATGALDPEGTSSIMVDALGQVQTGALALGQAFGGASNVSASTWSALAQGISADKAGLIDPAFAGVVSNLDTARNAFQAAGNIIEPRWRATADTIRGVQANTIDPAMTNTRNAVLFTADTFGVGADRIGTQWDGVKPKVAAPVRYTIDRVFNDGLVGMWNSVNGLLGTPIMPKYNIGSFASGTSRLPGYSPGVDNMTLTSADGSVGINLGGGEGIARPEVVRAIGPDRFDGLNAAAKIGGTAGVRKYLGSYAGGGIIDSMTAVIRSKFPGMSITSTYRPGDPGYHGRRQAVDFSNGSDSTAGMRASAGYIADNYPQPITAQLIHQPFNRNIGQGRGFVGDGLGFYGAGTMSEHRNHVHWAANGPVPLIPGGPIDPSLYASTDGMGSVDYTSIVAGMTKPYRDKIDSAVNGYSVPGMIGGLPKATAAKMTAAADAKIATATAAMQAASGSVSMGPLGGNSMDYARQIVDAAKERGLGKEGARIGIATALVESALRMYANASVPESLKFPHDAVGSDHDSVGLFQQRQAGWGTLAERMNAKASAGLFYNAMMRKFPNWRNMDPGAVAQGVQVSAYPGRYSERMGQATGIVDSVFDRGGVASGRGFMLKDVIHPERVLDAHQTETYDSMLPLLESVNASVRAGRAPVDPRDLELAGVGSVNVTGQRVENQYLVDPDAAERQTRRATKRALAGTRIK